MLLYSSFKNSTQSYEKSSEKPNLFELFRNKVTSPKEKLRKIESKTKRFFSFFA